MSEDKAVAWLREQVQARLEMANAVSVSLTGEVRAWAVNCNGEFDYTVYAESGVPHKNPLVDVWRKDVAGFLLANDPRQIMADCESDLAILDEHEEGEPAELRHGHWEGHGSGERWIRDEPNDCPVCHQEEPCRTVKAVASAYRHQPGYPEHWGDG